MVVRKDNNEMQKFSFVLHMNGNGRTLEILNDFPESSDLKYKQSIIKEIVKHVRQKNGLKDYETVVVKMKSTQREKGNESERKRDSMHTFDMGSKPPIPANSGFYCKECKVRYRNKHNFDEHMENHKSGNILNVEETIMNINDGATQNKRIRKKEPQKEVYCEKCNKHLLITRSGYRYHMKYFHLGVKKHACDICGRNFAMKGAMMEHRRIHTGERPFVCQVCGKAVRTSGMLYEHLQSHNDARPFSCPICHKTFKVKSHLRGHKLVHTGERKYVCELCGKGFLQRNEMKNHIMTHNSSKPFPCPICDSKFNQKRYLRQHLHGKHDFDSKEACSVAQDIVQLVSVSSTEQHVDEVPPNENVEASNSIRLFE